MFADAGKQVCVIQILKNGGSYLIHSTEKVPEVMLHAWKERIKEGLTN